MGNVDIETLCTLQRWALELACEPRVFELDEQLDEGNEAPVVSRIERRQVFRAVPSVDHEGRILMLLQHYEGQRARDAPVAVREWMDLHEPVVEPGGFGQGMLGRPV